MMNTLPCRTHVAFLAAALASLAMTTQAQTAPPAEAAASNPVAAASAPAATASAAEATMPVVRVKASAESETGTGPVPGYRAKRSTTATKTDTPLNEVPQAITVITADQVKDQNAQSMQEVLRYTAGARSEMYGLDNRGDWFSLRGGSEGSTLLDGLRLPLTGWYGVVRNEPYAFERIEVLRGPASVIAGQNGPGGVVNLVSKRPQAEAARDVTVQFGNNNHKQVAADLTGPLDADGSLLYRLVALGKDSDTQVNYAYDKRLLVAPSLTWKPTTGTTLTAFAEYQKDKTGNTNAFLGYQGTLLPAPNGPISESLFIGEPAWDRYGGERTRVGYHFEQRLSDDWTLRHNLRHDKVDGLMRTMYAAWWLGFADATGAADPNGTYLNRYWYFTDDVGRVTNADLLLEGKLQFGTTRHTLLLGVDGMKSFNSQKVWEDLGTPLDVYNPVYGSFAEPLLADVPAEITRVNNLGFLLQDQVKFGDSVVLVAGLRRDRAKSVVEGSAPTKDSATSKNLGVVFLAGGGWSPYANYSESFEPVVGTDATGTAFKPKRGKQIEAGVKWASADQRLGGAAALFQLKEKNRLATDPDPANVGFSVQRGEVTVRGLELEMTANLPTWELVASYAYTDAKITSTTADDIRYLGAQLNSIPEHAASVWAVQKFGAWGLPGLKAGLGLRYVGKTWDGLDTVSVPSYTLVDALVAYDLDAWRFAFNVGNLTNKTYLATCLERGDCWFGTKRKAIASVAYRW